MKANMIKIKVQNGTVVFTFGRRRSRGLQFTADPLRAPVSQVGSTPLRDDVRLRANQVRTNSGE